MPRITRNKKDTTAAATTYGNMAASYQEGVELRGASPSPSPNAFLSRLT